MDSAGVDIMFSQGECSISRNNNQNGKRGRIRTDDLLSEKQRPWAAWRHALEGLVRVELT